VTAPRVLVVDDDPPLRRFVARNLAARGCEVTEAGNGLEALAIVESQPLDLTILDIMMPRMDGLETCRRIRERSVMPIIVLTALSEQADKVRILDQGADDCLEKPFGVNELLARVRSALRRVRWSEQAATGTVLRYRDLTFDADRLAATCRGESLDLSRTELAVLRYLMEHLGRTVPHTAILEAVWGEEYRDETQYVRVYVSRLRQKIERDLGHPEYFFTEHGLGYRFGV
jgi:two-component system KDP operon response regulator KdpE